MPEYLVLLFALAALVVAHVLDDSNRGHLQLVEHLDTLDHIHVCQLLRRGNYHSRLDCRLLAQRQLDVARAWREIYDEEI